MIMKVDLLTYMKDFFESQGIQILFFKDALEDPKLLDYGFRKQFFSNYDDTWIRETINNHLSSGLLYCMEDDFFLNYAAFIFPEELRSDYGYRTVLIGPVIFQPVTTGDFHMVIKEYQIPPELHLQLKEFYNRIPRFGSFDQWASALVTFFSPVMGKRPELITLVGKHELLHHATQDNYTIPGTPTVSMKALEDRYKVEQEMMTAVSCGKTQEAIAAQIRFHQYTIAPRTPDPIRNKKNMLIIFNTLMRIAAQNGHVHPLHIDNLSTQLAIEIESASPSVLKNLGNKMIRKYCMLVQNYSRRSYSPLVQECLDFIDFHYAEDLSLERLANRCTVSNSYLSTLFKKEMQMTLTDYINSTRIRQALILLNSSNLSIQEIAIRCGFSDSNYFARTFKKIQGQSPKGYRESIRRTDKSN